MRIGLIQLNAKIGDFENNRLNIERWAESGPADLYVCPELSLSGYHCRDLFTRREFIDEDQRQLQKLVEWSKKTKKSIWVGHTLPKITDGEVALYNAASLISNGSILQQVLKRKLPNYNIFEEKRYFTANESAAAPALSFQNIEMSAEICEDSWTRIQRFALDEWSTYPPSSSPTSKATTPSLLVNLSASPFVSGKPHTRRAFLAELARQKKSFIAYSSYSGAQDELVFDGQSAIYAPNGDCLFEAPAFSEGLFVADINLEGNNAKAALPTRNRWADIHAGLCTFVRDYVRKSGFESVVLGLSGGIDSALCAAICVDALGPQNVLGVGLATQWTSDLSKNEAELLADNLGIKFLNLSIEEGIDPLKNIVGESLKPLSQENLQSRLRGLVLMTLSNNQNRLLISTANKSEIAMGYSTLYGDMCGAIMPIGDLYKTEVYGLSHYINLVAGYERIPKLTLQRAPTAELAPGQKDSDSLPEYAKLDAFLEVYLEYRDRLTDERDRLDHFISPFTCDALIKKIQLNEFKRIQSPLICKVHHRSFGKHWNMPVAKNY